MMYMVIHKIQIPIYTGTYKIIILKYTYIHTYMHTYVHMYIQLCNVLTNVIRV